MEPVQIVMLGIAVLILAVFLISNKYPPKISSRVKYWAFFIVKLKLILAAAAIIIALLVAWLLFPK